MSTGLSLADLEPKQQGRIRTVVGDDGLTQRLWELGFTPGQRVDVIRFAPLGDPIQVRVRGFDVALRRAEARRILLEPSEPR
jgi:Fe2+ transport system protein FeoA